MVVAATSFIAGLLIGPFAWATFKHWFFGDWRG